MWYNVSVAVLAYYNKYNTILHGLVRFLGFDYILSQMFLWCPRLTCARVRGEGWIRMKASRQSVLGKQNKKKKITEMYIFLFIANRDGLQRCLARGLGPLIITELTVALPPLHPCAIATSSPMWNFIFHCSTRWLSWRDTSAAFIRFMREKKNR